MNIKKILLLLFFSVLPINSAFCHSNKTFLKRRPIFSNLPMRLDESKKSSFLSSVQSFYVSQETFAHKLNSYFFIHNKGALKLIASRTDNLFKTTKGDMDDVDMTYLNHAAYFDEDDVNDLNAINMVLTNKPNQTVNGFTLKCQHQFGTVNGCFIYANVPLTYVRTEMHLKLSGTPILDYQKTLFTETEQFFSGDLEKPPFYLSLDDLTERAAQGRGQVKLTNAKFSDKSLYSTGFSDIDAGVGYVFLDKPAYHLSGACLVTFPAGNKPKGEFVFEPIRGNGGHVGIGATVDGWVRLFKGRKRDLKAVVALDWRYLFSAHEMRTLGLKDRDWGHYYNLGKMGQAEMIPAANVLTRSVDVRPGSYGEGMLGLAYHDKEFIADLGYDVFFRGRESVRLLDFPDKTYAVAARGHSTARPTAYDPGTGAITAVGINPFTISAMSVDQGDVEKSTINLHTIDTGVAESPSQCINAIYGSLGFVFDNEPIATTLLSLGGMVEFPTNNAALEQWTLWVKMGVGF